MNIGYIRIIKSENNRVWKNNVNTIKCNDINISLHEKIYNNMEKSIIVISNKIKNAINKVDQDKHKKNEFTIYNLSEKTKKKLIKKLSTEKIEYIIAEQNEDLGFPTISDKDITKYMIPEIVDLCYKMTKPKIDEIHVCTNIFNSVNRKIIEELIDKVKVVNIVTSNNNYYRFERRLEEKDIFITVSNNKRKSLKNASIVVNLDYENYNDYNINRNMVIIDITGSAKLPKSFNGIVVRKVLINTKKVMRIFSEFKEFDRNRLIEAEMMKLENYDSIRKFINFNKVYIDGLYNVKRIDLSDFKRIEKINNGQYKKGIKKKNPPSVYE